MYVTSQPPAQVGAIDSSTAAVIGIGAAGILFSLALYGLAGYGAYKLLKK